MDKRVIWSIGLLGRENKSEVILFRYLQDVLEKLNPNILQIAYESAMEQIAQEVATQVKDLIYDNLLRLPEEAYNDEDVSMKTISVYQHGYSNYFGGGKSVYE